MKDVSFLQNSASNIGGAMKLFFDYSLLKAETIILENSFDIKRQAINQGRPAYFLLSFYDIITSDQLSNLENFVRNSELTVIINPSIIINLLCKIENEFDNQHLRKHSSSKCC